MSYSVPDSVKCLDGVDYEVVKHNTHFEWVAGFEKTIKELALDVFETSGVKDGNRLNAAIKSLDEYQENLKPKMDDLVKQVAAQSDVSDKAKTFVVEWAEACKYQISLKYHHMGDGPNAQKIRWAFESAIKYIVICATNLADQDNSVDFKKQISNYVKNFMIQSLIDALQKLQIKLKSLENNS